MKTLDPLFEVPGYQVSRLDPTTIPALQALLERCADYEQLVSGESPSSTAAENLLSSCPPGRSTEDKIVFGISAGDGQLVGVLDAMRNYPQEQCCWVGLLLIEPAMRNQGLGRLVYEAFERWAFQNGFAYILLGVIEANEKAYRFWQSLGFELVEKQPPRQFGIKQQVVITMVRRLGI